MALVPFPNKAQTPAPDDHDPDWDESGPESERTGKMSFLEHLDELRKRIVWALVAIIGGALIAAFFRNQIFDFIMSPIIGVLPKGQTLIFTEPTEALMLYLKMIVLVGLLVASPAGSTAYNFSAHGPILPLGSHTIALTPIAPYRPRRWRGAILKADTEVRFRVLDPYKRPVSVTADSHEVRDVVEVTIRESRERTVTLLFDPEHNLEERILSEQFVV